MKLRFWRTCQGNPEDRFPKEVLDLRRERGVPLPTWYAGPLHPSDGSERAAREFEKYLHRHGRSS